jgi:DNA-binding CsgD family transcriptional regulator
LSGKQETRMTGLGRDDLGRVLDLVAALAEAKDLPGFVHTTMHGLLELIPSIDVSYNEMNPAAERAEYRVWPLPEGDLLERSMPAFERLMRQNPLVTHMEATGDTRALMWSDFVTIEEIQSTELYHELFRHLGVDSQMAVSLPTPAGVVVGFALNRGSEGFTERDRVVLNTLRPHLVHAYRTVQLDAGLSTLQHALGATGWTAALVADDAEVRSVTDGGIDALADAGVDIELGRTLPRPIATPFVSSIASYRPSQPSVLSRPIRLSDERDGVAGWYVPGPVAPHVVLFRGAVDLDTAPLRALGLRPREIEVAVALAEGGTNAQLAERLGMAEGTLRKHLERVYRALEVDNRTGAAARVHQLTTG